MCMWVYMHVCYVCERERERDASSFICVSTSIHPLWYACMCWNWPPSCSPPAQLLQSVYDDLVPRPQVCDITVEDPSDEFRTLRDFVDCSNALKLDCLQLHKAFDESAKKVRAKLKLQKVSVKGKRHHTINQGMCKLIFCCWHIYECYFCRTKLWEYARFSDCTPLIELIVNSTKLSDWQWRTGWMGLTRSVCLYLCLSELWNDFILRKNRKALSSYKRLSTH